MLNRIHCISFSHKRAPVEVREFLARRRDDLASFRAELCKRFEGAVVLSTCGRFEIYVATQNVDQYIAWGDFFGIDAAFFDDYAVCRAGQSAVEHLLMVAAGLDSPLPGEDHILGQVRDAFLAADEQGATDPLLSALFRAAIACGRRVRRETGIRQLATSYATQSIEILNGHVSHDESVAIVGSGSLAHEVALGLRVCGHRAIEIVSRHEQRGRDLAKRVGCKWHGWNELAQRLSVARAAVCCTAARQPIVTKDVMNGLQLPQCIVDLGMPRNVDAVVRERCAAFFDLESLPGARALMSDVLEGAKKIVAQESRRYLDWSKRRVAAHERLAQGALVNRKSIEQGAAA